MTHLENQTQSEQNKTTAVQANLLPTFYRANECTVTLKFTPSHNLQAEKVLPLLLQMIVAGGKEKVPK